MLPKLRAWCKRHEEMLRVVEVFDDETKGLANVVLYHNQNPIAQGECSADAGNGNEYYSVCSLKIKDVHYPVVEH